jgi:hypothetical protein
MLILIGLSASSQSALSYSPNSPGSDCKEYKVLRLAAERRSLYYIGLSANDLHQTAPKLSRIRFGGVQGVEVGSLLFKRYTAF